jgi:uncharacterized protein (TIGR02996 family)
MSEAAFIATIRAAPGDDAPRLIFADWLEEQGNPFGEFIRVQCALTREHPSDDSRNQSWYDELRGVLLPREGPLVDRERQLLAEHEPTWVGPLWDGIKDWPMCRRFRRGFVEEVCLPAQEFLRHAPLLFERCPLLHGLALTASRGSIPDLAACPYLARLTELDLGVGATNLADAEVLALAGSPHLTGLQCLRLGDNLSTVILGQMACAPAFLRLERLVLEWDAYLGERADLIRQREAEVNQLFGRNICHVIACN